MKRATLGVVFFLSVSSAYAQLRLDVTIGYGRDGFKSLASYQWTGSPYSYAADYYHEITGTASGVFGHAVGATWSHNLTNNETPQVPNCYQGHVSLSGPEGTYDQHSLTQVCFQGPPGSGGGVPVACDPGHGGCYEGFPEPLILDLDGGGIRTTSLERSPVDFDMDGNGVKDLTAWTDPRSEEGFLFFDTNHNGVIDGGQELFGDATVLPDGSRANTGVEVLGLCDTRRYGGNGDGVISRNDLAFYLIRVWVAITMESPHRVRRTRSAIWGSRS